MKRPTVRPIAALWEWQESAACRQLDSARFFAPAGERGVPKRERERAAQRICAGCPVREECAEFALAHGERHGVWGGTTAAERATRKRRVERDMRPDTSSAASPGRLNRRPVAQVH